MTTKLRKGDSQETVAVEIEFLKRNERLNKYGGNDQGTADEGTYFDGGDAKATGFEDDADTARSHAFAQSTHHSSGHQHVLHLSLSVRKSLRFLGSL